MRDLSQFSLKEWCRLKPVFYALSQGRDDIRQMYYCHQRAKNQDDFLKNLMGVNHLTSIVAFEQPWALNWQLKMAHQNLTDVQLVVFDNSREPELRHKIAEVCRLNNTPYLALPSYSTRHINLSHGMAMNWIYQNIVKIIRPKLFSYIDHDMIPVLPSTYSHKLVDQPLYGLPRVKRSRWYLWAGYCAFDFDFVNNKKINFLEDCSNELDTGGRNWHVIYNDSDLDTLQFADQSFFDVLDPATKMKTKIEIIDKTWFHIGGIGYNDNFKKKAALCEYLADALNTGYSWSDLCQTMSLVTEKTFSS